MAKVLMRKYVLQSSNEIGQLPWKIQLIFNKIVFIARGGMNFSPQIRDF